MSKDKVIKYTFPKLYKQKIKQLKNKIYRNVQKRAYNKIIKEVKRLKRLKHSILAKQENIMQKELNYLKNLSELPTKLLGNLVKLRNIDYTGLKRGELLYILMHSEKPFKEPQYINNLLATPANDKQTIINTIRQYITNLDMLLAKSDRDKIRKRLCEIENTNLNRKQSKKLINELSDIFNNLKFEKEHTNSAFDSSDYYGLKDLEYTFGDLDDYYKPILARESFDGNYQMYTCRGKIDSTPINDYLAKLRPYLVTILDDKKRFNK